MLGLVILVFFFNLNDSMYIFIFLFFIHPTFPFCSFVFASLVSLFFYLGEEIQMEEISEPNECTELTSK